MVVMYIFVFILSFTIGVVKANEPNLLKEFGGHLGLTGDLARHLLRSMVWVKRKGSTGKVEPSKKFLQEEKFPYQREISRVVLKHDVPLDVVLNLDQTPLSYVSPGKHAFCLKGSTTVLIKGVDDKRQITATFIVSATGAFLPIQLIYQGATKMCLRKYKFPKEFNVTYTKNHWSNLEKCVDLIEKIISPYLRAKKIELGYTQEQFSLIFMDNFKDQDKEEIKSLYLENNCQLIIVPIFNQKAKKFVPNQFNKWYGERVNCQLTNGKSTGDVKVSLKLSDLKPLHAKWV